MPDPCSWWGETLDKTTARWPCWLYTCSRRGFFLNFCRKIISNPCFRLCKRRGVGGFFSVLWVTALMVWMIFFGDDTAGLYPFASFGAVLGGGGAISGWMAPDAERPQSWVLEQEYLARKDCDRVVTPRSMLGQVEEGRRGRRARCSHETRPATRRSGLERQPR